MFKTKKEGKKLKLSIKVFINSFVIFVFKINGKTKNTKYCKERKKKLFNF